MLGLGDQVQGPAVPHKEPALGHGQSAVVGLQVPPQRRVPKDHGGAGAAVEQAVLGAVLDQARE